MAQFLNSIAAATAALQSFLPFRALTIAFHGGVSLSLLHGTLAPLFPLRCVFGSRLDSSSCRFGLLQHLRWHRFPVVSFMHSFFARRLTFL